MKGAIEKARAMRQAARKAEQTPDEVRRAFLESRVKIAGFDIEPFTLGILWLLEEFEHPLIDATRSGEPLKLRELAQAIFIYTDSSGARAALSEGRECFDARAHELARQILPADLKALSDAIAQRTAEGMATVPGSGGGNPPPAQAGG